MATTVQLHHFTQTKDLSIQYNLAIFQPLIQQNVVWCDLLHEPPKATETEYFQADHLTYPCEKLLCIKRSKEKEKKRLLSRELPFGMLGNLN